MRTGIPSLLTEYSDWIQEYIQSPISQSEADFDACGGIINLTNADVGEVVKVHYVYCYQKCRGFYIDYMRRRH